MFSPNSTLAAQQSETLTAKVGALNDSAESWFDGTEASITARRRKLEGALHFARQLDTDDAICIAAELEAEVVQMANFADIASIGASLEEPLARTATVEPLTARGREFVAVQSGVFLADNADALSNAEELDIRASRFVSQAVSGLPVSEGESIVAHFRDRVAEAVQPEPPVLKESNIRSNFDDALLYG